jgi:hypothetical protein
MLLPRKLEPCQSRLCRRTVRKAYGFPRRFLVRVGRLRLQREAQPRLNGGWQLPERQSLSALCGGEAAI